MLELIPAGPEQAGLIRNLYQFYAYESSDWEEEDVEVDGRFYVNDAHMDRYWQSPGWSASLVLFDGFIAGFVLVEQSELPGMDVLELADLFVLKRYRRQGIGCAVAAQMLATPGSDWLVRYYGQDEVAVAFWQAVLQDLPRSSRFIELDDEPELLNILVSAVRH